MIYGNNNSFAQEQIYECNGLQATIIGEPDAATIYGTIRDDVIVGTNDNSQEVIIANGGSDAICAGLGHNIISTRGNGNTIITTPGSTNAIYAQYGIGDTCYLQPGDFEMGCETIIMINDSNESMLTLSTDLPSYALNQPIQVNGLIEPFVADNIPVTIDISIMNPDKTVVSNTVIDIIRLDGAFGFVAEGDFTQPGIYTVEGVTNDGQRGSTTFEILAATATATVTISIDNQLPEFNQDITVSGTFENILLPNSKVFLVDVISPSGDSLADVRGQFRTEFIGEERNTWSENIQIRPALSFFQSPDEYRVVVYLASQSDLGTDDNRPLPRDIPKSEILAETTFKILNLQPFIDPLQTTTTLRIDQGEFLPNSTQVTTSNLDHVLRLSFTNNQGLFFPPTITTITIASPDNSDGEQFTDDDLPDGVATFGISANFVPNIPGDYLFTFDVREDTEARPLIISVNHTVTVSGVTTNPEMTTQELSDKVVELEAIIADLLARILSLENP